MFVKDEQIMYEIFERLLQKTGTTAYQVSKNTGISQATLSAWKKGTYTPKQDKLQKIADYFGITIDDLLGRSDSTPKQKGVLIPTLGTVKAGIPLDAIEEIIDYEEIPVEMAKQGEFFSLRVKGDSMEPRIMEGDSVIVRKQPDADSGDIVIALVNGNEATVKKLKKTSDGIMLIPNNSKYDVMFFSKKDIEELPLTILGKVVELRGKF